MKFDEMLSRVLATEGGYSNDPTDKGGETYCGISRLNWPGWRGWPAVDEMKAAGLVPAGLHSLVEDFYREHFWRPVRCDSMGDPKLAYEMLEMAVNLGTHRAVSILQEALNLLNRGGSSWPELVVDGAMGPRTLGTVKQARAADVVKVVNALQAEHYLNIARRSPAQEKYLRGWLAR